ncbi:MAG: Mut7-C RNAse domain-containing protein [Caldimicrobium sp.]
MVINERTFYLESSLSGLAKWLRFMGLKVEIAKQKLGSEEILKNKDKFFLVTSPETAQFLEKRHLDYLLLPRGSLKTQLLFLIHRLNLPPKLSLDICTLCGERLISVKKEDFMERIPQKVKEKYSEFNYCPKCDKLYWEGDHVKRIKEKFKDLITFPV